MGSSSLFGPVATDPEIYSPRHSGETIIMSIPLTLIRSKDGERVENTYPWK